jgi:glyoxylase-like metal-dependent hydrolase (beta-lactamase superfamily II)
MSNTPFEHLHAIELPTPFPVGPVTVYLADAPGEPLTLLDTGPVHPPTWSALHAGLLALGYAPARLERIVLSHAHVDHVGLAADLVDASGAQVLTHPWNVAQLSDHTADRERTVAFYTDLLRRAAVPAEMLAAVGWVTKGMERFARPVSVSATLAEGRALRLAGRDWQVLHTPGHSAGLICLYEPQSRLLLSSDHLLADISSNPVVEPPPPGQAQRLCSLAAYRDSLRRVAAMDIALALPSHGPAIVDVAGLVAQRLAFHEQRLAQVLDALRDGARTTWDVVHALFPNRSPLDTFLAVSEVIGHLDVLEIEDKIGSNIQDGIVQWSMELAQARDER